jgi:hypothetical protein
MLKGGAGLEKSIRIRNLDGGSCSWTLPVVHVYGIKLFPVMYVHSSLDNLKMSNLSDVTTQKQ